jgi:hypothetical protein
MERFKSINHINMIMCGDYCWEVLIENDGSEVYRLIIRTKTNYQSDITLMYGEGIFSVRNFRTTYCGGDFFCFKMDFKDTPIMVERLINGEDGYLQPLYHKNTIKKLKSKQHKIGLS